MPIALLEDTEPPWFPNPDSAPDHGLLAVGGILTTERLLLAYSKGIFPWELWGEPPLWHWHSPNPRFLLVPDEFRISRSLKAVIKKDIFEVRIDTAFLDVMNACSRMPRKNQAGTWIAPEMIASYGKLHEEGYAHSFESIRGDKLVGGLYGISLGKAFFGESMFYLEPEASKVALAQLVTFTKANAFHFIDCQMPTDHLAHQGAREIPRPDFLDMLRQSLEESTLLGKWSL